MKTIQPKSKSVQSKISKKSAVREVKKLRTSQRGIKAAQREHCCGCS